MSISGQSFGASYPISKTYRVIYADPPWRFETYSGKGRGRCADAHYDVLDFSAIREFPVGDWAERDSVLLLWATDPLLPKALELISAWGFKYKTVAFYWVKLNKSAPKTFLTERDFFTGMGYWTRANPEMCLLATRGHPKRVSKDVRRLIVDHRREHSRKPEETYDRIEKLVDGPYLEMFARGSRPGWDALGNQVGLFDDGPISTRRWPSPLKDTEQIETGRVAEGDD